jgi:hypothetical protein
MKILFISMLFYTCIPSTKNLVKKDEYAGMVQDQLVEKFGTPEIEIDHAIDNYYSPSWGEPIYTNYFSEEELDKTVHIKIFVWTKNKKIITVWLRLVETRWIAFSSLERPDTPSVAL